jgi:hypothetical protein
MSAQKRRREVSPATRGAIAYARYQNRSPLRVIQARTGVSLSTISDICNHAHKQAKMKRSLSMVKTSLLGLVLEGPLCYVRSKLI